ncbi:hypothetical protein BH23GEM2_BH23GEM2_21750 [soil metagenome]
MHDTGSGSSPGDIHRPFRPGEEDAPHDSSAPGDETAGAYDSAVDAGGVVPPFVPGREPLHYSQGIHDTPPDVIVDQVAGLASHAVELPSITDFLYDEPEPDALAESGYGPLTGEHATPASEAPAQTPSYGSPGLTPASGGQQQTPAYSSRQQTPAYSSRQQTPGYGVPQEPPPYLAHPTPARDTRAATPARSTPVPPLPGFTPSRTSPAAAVPASDLRMAPVRPQGFGPPPPSHAPPAQPTPSQGLEPWATGEWQRYDWRAAAALGAEERARASQAWADLDWEGEARSRATQRNSEIAAALEELARRVRAGELRVHGHAGMSEEAAAAAALAALLAKRP